MSRFHNLRCARSSCTEFGVNSLSPAIAKSQLTDILYSYMLLLLNIGKFPISKIGFYIPNQKRKTLLATVGHILLQAGL